MVFEVFKLSPRLDLEAIWEMNYGASASEIFEKYLRSMNNHLWYIHSSNIPFSLLVDEKSEIADALLDLSGYNNFPSEYDKPKMSILNSDKEQRLSLASLVDSGSKLLFNVC